MSDQAPILLGRNGTVATIRFNRPEKLNAIDFDLAEDLISILQSVAADSGVRAVVLCGSGRAFMGGGDLSCFQGGPEKAPKVAHALIDAFHVVIRLIATMDKAVISAIHGATAGGGMSIALASDCVIAAESTRLSFAYSKIGVSPDGGLSHFLPDRIGIRKAFEIAMLSDPIGATEALTLGLVNRVVANDALEQEALAWARRFAQVPPQALARTKALLRQSGVTSLDRQLDQEQVDFAACAGTSEFHERIDAFLNRSTRKSPAI